MYGMQLPIQTLTRTLREDWEDTATVDDLIVVTKACEDAGFGFIDERTPEHAIAVVPSRRGRGYGHELLGGLLDCARKDGFEAISLSVAKDNPARHLYENYGFQPVREDDGAVVMRAPLSEANP